MVDRRRFLLGIAAAGFDAELGAPAASAEERSQARDFDVRERSLAALSEAMGSGLVSSVGLTVAYLDRIARFDQAGPGLHSVLALNPGAIAAARGLDNERAAGAVRSRLHGIPVVIKDNIETSDPVPTTAGSLALANARHATDAPLVARLRAAGAVILGKANLSEWANFRSSRSISGWSAVGGQTRNAYDRDRGPEGSSSGSAVATAANLCGAAIGTETDGSILAPASVNGVVGLKPTHGLVSGRGIVPISPNQDTAGPISRTVEDAALLASIIGEQPLGFGRFGSASGEFRLRGVRVGALPASKSAHPAVVKQYAEWCTLFEHEGAVVSHLSAPAAMDELAEAEDEVLQYEFKTAINGYLATVDPAQGSCRSLAEVIEFNRVHARDEFRYFGQDVFEKAQSRGPLTDAAYRKLSAHLRQSADLGGLRRLFAKLDRDVLVAPANGPAALIDTICGDRTDDGWPLIATAAAIAGYPSLTVPGGFVDHLPVGLVLVAPRYQDGLLLQVAGAFERARGARAAPRFDS